MPWFPPNIVSLRNVSEVSEENQLQGYRYLLRAEEIWSMTKRAQHFTNWCTKLPLDCTVQPQNLSRFNFMPSIHSARQDGLGLDVAEAWKVDVNVHIIRKASYKGSGARVDATRLKIPFDGLTLPGTLFLVS